MESQALFPGYRAENDEKLGRLGFSLLHRLPHEREEEAELGLEHEGGCDLGIFCACGITGM